MSQVLEGKLEDSTVEASHLKDQMDRETQRNARSEQRYLKAAATLAEELTTAEAALKQATAKHQVCQAMLFCFHAT